MPDPTITPAPPPGPPPGGEREAATGPAPARVARAVVLVVYAFVLVDLVMLTLGFVLRLFGASTDAAFTRWVYRSVDRIMEPFRGMFPTRPLGDEAVVDVSLLFAVIVYAIIGMALHALILWLAEKARPRPVRVPEPGRPRR